MNTRCTSLGAVALMTLACRPPLGEPNYPDPAGDTDVIDDGGLPGDNPYQDGEERLTFGFGYEGGSSEQILVDNEQVNLYIYDNSLTITEDEDHVEGFVSQRFTVQNEALGYWGGGIHFDGRAPVDMSQWTTLNVALKSPSAEMEAMEFRMASAGAEGSWRVADYGFEADDNWHYLDLPLDELSPSIDLTAVTIGTIFISTTSVDGTYVLVDDFYFTAEPTE